MNLNDTEWKRLFATTLYRQLQIKLAEMRFEKDFIAEAARGNPLPSYVL